MSNKKPKIKSNYEIYQSIRRDWSGLNPTTRVKDSDKIYSRQKNKLESVEIFEDYCDEEYLKDIYEE